jgi:hypothetical protein
MTTITRPERPHFTPSDHEASHEAMSTRVNTAVTVVSGSAYTFSIADFDLIGGSGEGLSAVHIAGLERRGALTLCGVPVPLNEVVTRDEIDAGQLQFLAGHGAEGHEYDSFLFMTHDGADWTGSPMSMRLHAVLAEVEPTVDVVPENTYEPPVAIDSLVNTSEGTVYTFKPSDFNFQGAEGEFEHIQLVSLDMCGLLQFDGVEVTFGQVIPVEDLDLDTLTFEPQEPGKEGFEFKVHDGTSWSEEAFTMTVDVAPYYHPPTASDNAFETVVGESFVFGTSEFKYNDFDGDELVRIQITRIECAGVIRLDGVPIDPNQLVTRRELDDGSLDFVPPDAGEEGAFWFKVHDGTAYSTHEYQMSVVVVDPKDEEPVYDAPAHDDQSMESALVEAMITGDAPSPDLEPDTAPIPAPAFDTAEPEEDVDSDREPAPAESPLPASEPADAPPREPAAEIAEDAPALDSATPGRESGLYPAPSSPSETTESGVSRPRPRMQRHYELTVTTREDTAFIFSATDLSPDSTPISEIQVTSMEICGLLQLDGMAVTPGQRITKANFDEGRVTFIPAGVGTHRYFDFKVRRGPKWSMAKCSMSIEVTAAYNHGRPTR